jgi:hypothetical protein
MTGGTDPGHGPFGSRAQLREAFEAGLLRMLEGDSLGAFILVLANASFEDGMSDRLRKPLAAAFERWSQAATAGDPAYQGAAADDVTVFEQLRQLDLDSLGVTRWRRLGPWEAQFNPLRALRPARVSGARVDALSRPFDPQGFHFDKPFLRDEILWEGRMRGVAVRLLYNKFPFAELHGLLVPDPSAGRPQFLSADYHRLIWAITGDLATGLPGVGFGYNAFGAFASINHLHFQMFERSQGEYPIESPLWRHNGGTRAYPLPVMCFDDLAAAWRALADCQSQNLAFNLLYRPGRLYLVQRALQGHYRHSLWTAGFAWSELAGSVTVVREEDFERLDGAAIEAELGRLAVRP